MSPVEETKLWLAIKGTNDVGQLREHARRLLVTLGAITRAGPHVDSYTVHDANSLEVAHGTKDYCIGWAEGRQGVTVFDGIDEYKLGPYKVMCGDFEVWPNWGGVSA